MPGERDLSRRHFLLLGMLGGAAAATCAGGGLLGVGWLLRRRDTTPTDDNIRVLTNLTETPMPNSYPELITKAAWGGLPPNHNSTGENGFFSAENSDGWRVYDQPLTDVYNTVVVHHSVVYEGDDLSTMLAVQTLHREQNNWADVGYHYLIGKSGAVYEGRDIRARGAHVAGYNTGTIGVCLLGNFEEDTPPPVQIAAAHTLIGWLATTFALTHIDGHRAFNDWTQCPGVNLTASLDDFATRAGLTVGTEGYVAPES
jgi:hypothetical protein